MKLKNLMLNKLILSKILCVLLQGSSAFGMGWLTSGQNWWNNAPRAQATVQLATDVVANPGKVVMGAYPYARAVWQGRFNNGVNFVGAAPAFNQQIPNGIVPQLVEAPIPQVPVVPAQVPQPQVAQNILIQQAISVPAQAAPVQADEQSSILNRAFAAVPSLAGCETDCNYSSYCYRKRQWQMLLMVLVM